MSPSKILSDYPLSEKRRESLTSPLGKPLREITLEAVLKGEVLIEDLRVTPEALELQAQIAEAAGRPTVAENFRRAAELANVPDDQVVKIYQALRPGRTGREELLRLVEELEGKYRAHRCARLVRDAAAAYFKAST